MSTKHPHPSLKLSDLDPTRSITYSPNLYQWMKKNVAFLPGGGCEEAVYLTKKGSDAAAYFGPDSLIVGLLIKGVSTHFFSGAKLLSIISSGSNESKDYVPIDEDDLVHVGGFWDLYMRIGRCAADPEHNHYFHGPQRFRIKGSSAECLWCGCKKDAKTIPKQVAVQF